MSIHTPDNWDAASEGYGERVAPFMMTAFAEAMVERLDCTGECKALEVAAGTGALTGVLARQVKSVLATDFAPKMLDVLRRRMADAGVSNVSFEVMDGQALSVEDGSFDRAASSFALMLFPDRAKGFAELRRALRPGGRAVVSGWAGPDKFEGFSLFLGALQAAYPDLPPPAEPPPVFSLANLDVFKEEMEAAGFTDVAVSYEERELEVEDLEQLWGMFTAGAPPVKVLFDRVGADGPARIKDALGELVSKQFGDGPIRMTNVATVGCGTAPG